MTDSGRWPAAPPTTPLVHMALVPRVLEARGLDVTPGMIERLTAVGDTETAARLDVILREEVGHVAAGTRWFRFLCEQRGLDPLPTYSGGVSGPQARCLRTSIRDLCTDPDLVR